MKKLIFTCSVLFNLFNMASCSDDEARPETIDKLRSIGVAYDPFVSGGAEAPATEKLGIGFFVATSVDQEISYKTFDISTLSVNPVYPLDLTNSTLKLEHDGEIKIYSITANTFLPSKNQLLFLPELPYFSYSSSLEFVQGEESEKIISNHVFYPENSEELKWVNNIPKVEIQSITENQTVKLGEIELKANITNRNPENYKVAWFVLNGKLTNRNAISTTWKEMKAGKHTIIVTIHGKKTSSFSWHAVNFTVE